jgi:hypothetical protein
MALAMFLLDVFCLGVRDTFFAIVGRDEYDRRLRSWREAESLQRIDPAGLRKLLEGGVVYARELGFNPPPDYVVMHKIFGDVEAAACPSRFQYGHAGKPFYISGPMRPRLECGLSSTSSSGAWARKTLSTSC